MYDVWATIYEFEHMVWRLVKTATMALKNIVIVPNDVQFVLQGSHLVSFSQHFSGHVHTLWAYFLRHMHTLWAYFLSSCW